MFWILPAIACFLVLKRLIPILTDPYVTLF